ncbi:MAG: glycosyltransferase family 39 protein [Chloroflexi bacterium]|nr:glycosyltransferase family 39 protein [Chloroflexota bacterium]
MKKRLVRLCVVVLTLVGFALRIYRVEHQSLWYDEAFSVDLAGRGIEAITLMLSTVENHPPLYFYILHYWMALAGESEFAVRFLSLIFGSLAVPSVFVLGRRLLGNWGGLIAALLAAFSPVHVQYSQEARMYALVTILSIASMYAVLRALEDDNARSWVGLVAANLLAIYSHYYAALVIVAEWLMAAIWLTFLWHKARGSVGIGSGAGEAPSETIDRVSRRVFPRFVRLFLAGGALAVGYLPWLGVPLAQMGGIANYYQGNMDLSRVGREIAEMLATGGLGPPERLAVATWGISFLAVLGWIAVGSNTPAGNATSTGSVDEMDGVHRRRGGGPALAVLERDGGNLKANRSESGLVTSRHQARLFLGLYLLLPVALAFVLLTQRPKFGPQYLLIVWPAFVILLASGLQAPFGLGRKVGFALTGLLLACVMGGSLVFLNIYYYDPGYARHDWRSAAGYVDAQRQENDAVLLISGYAAPAFRYYYPGDDWLAVPDRPVMTVYDVVDYDEVGHLLQKLAGKTRVWLVLWQDEVADPNRLIPETLAQFGRASPVKRFGEIAVSRYDLPEDVVLEFNAKPQTSLDVNFGDRVQLLGYNLATPSVQPAASVTLTLFWKALAPLDDDYNVAVRVTDGGGREWGRTSKRPASYLHYTQRWRVDSLVSGAVPLSVLYGTPPGEYDLQVGLFSAAKMKSLDVIDRGIPVGTDVLIGHLTVERAAKPPSFGDLELSSPRIEDAGQGMLWLGATLPVPEVSAGGRFDLTTFWEATGAQRGDLLLELRLLDSEGRELGRRIERPAGQSYSTEKWQDGDRLRGQHALVAPPQIHGPVRIVGRLLEASTGAPVGNEIVLAEGRVLDRPYNTTRAPVPKAIQQARLGDVIRLLGYDLDAGTAVRAGHTIGLRLYWQSAGGIQKSYKVFTHLLDKEQRIWAQSDGIPGRGMLPTTSWISGEFVDDDYSLEIKREAPPGEYVLEIGMYLEATGERLPVFDDLGAPLGDRIILNQRVQIGVP